MKTRTRWILAALTVVLLPLVISVPLSKAQVSRISRGALLLQKNVLSLPGRIFGSAMLGSSAKLAGGEPNKDDGVIAGSSYRNDTSPPLRDLPPSPVSTKGKAEHEANANPKIPNHHVDGGDTVVQRRHFSAAPTIPGTILNFEGIPFPGVACNCAPPDTNGEVGATQYVQIVNEGFQVFDKLTGGSVMGPVGIQTLWAGFGAPCETNGDGDPVVIYDQLANRWVISQFAGASIPTDECVAVSTTSDATGSYNRYGFHLGTNFFDYPKLAVWPDAYYMSMNVFNSSATAFLGPQPFAFDRAAMLAGDPATFVSTGITVGPTEDPYLPADLDGSRLPPAGAPATFVEWPGSGVYKVYHMHTDFAVPANSTFTLFASPAAAPFTELCPTTRACVPQLGSTTNLDGIGDRLMFRAATRFFPDDHEATVGNFSVLSGGVSGIRWFELRDATAGPVTVFQESTYQPDTDWRWMGSAAMDNQANLALGFSASSATIFPQIRYAGRLATDPLNTLAQGEAHLFDGTGSQSDTSSRWGDYSDLTIDPVDDCTFWYTTEYYATTSSFNWRTRIGNFKFAECTPQATGTAHFVVTICDGGSPLANALVTIDGSLTGATAADGTYDATLPAGTHSFSISKATFDTATGTFDITDGATTNVPVCLTGVPVIVPAGSTLVDESCVPPNGAIDPNENVTVSFALMNTGGASTTNLVATLQNSGGVTPTSGPQSYGSIAPGGTAARDFSFIASGACGGTITATLQLQDGATNLGTATYTFTLGVLTVALTENFDGVTPPALPAGWMAANASGPAPLWVTSNSGTPAPPADTAPNAAFVDDPNVVSDKRLDSPSIPITSSSAQVTFRNNYALENTFDGGVLEISIGGGAFTDIVTAGGSFVTGGYNGSISSSFSNPLAGRQAWTGSSGGFITTTANLPAAAAGNNVQLRWRMGSDTSVAATGWRVDTVQVSDGFVCCGPQIVAAGSNLVSESCPPSNGAIDPGETVTVSLCVRNTGLSDTVDLVGTLLATGGVTNPSGPQDYGVVVGGGAAVCRDFTFTAEGTCGGTLTASLQLQDGPNNLGTVTYTFPLGTTVPATATFSNATPIIIPASGTGSSTGSPATPYPSDIAVSGVSGLVTKVTVSLNDMNHTFPSDVDVLLVGPGGQKFIILSDVIGGTDWVGINYTLDDAAASLVPSSGTPVSGTFKPTNYGTGDLFPPPAPAAPYESPATAGSATFASVFNGSNPNGTWSLYVVDDAAGDIGNFNGGWSVTITTAEPVCTTPCPPPTETPTPTNTPTPTPTPTSTPTPTPTAVTGNQGCGTGYWKQQQHFDSWCASYTPTTLVSTVFDTTDCGCSFGSLTFLQALQGAGFGPTVCNAQAKLYQMGVAALLNACPGSGVAYALSTAQVISEVNTALQSCNRTTILNEAGRLDGFNNGSGGCPLH